MDGFGEFVRCAWGVFSFVFFLCYFLCLGAFLDFSVSEFWGFVFFPLHVGLENANDSKCGDCWRFVPRLARLAYFGGKAHRIQALEPAVTFTRKRVFEMHNRHANITIIDFLGTWHRQPIKHAHAKSFHLTSLCHAPTNLTLPHFSNRTDTSRTYVGGEWGGLGVHLISENGYTNHGCEPDVSLM